MKNSNTTLKSIESAIVDGTPFRVSTTPHAPIGAEVDDGKEGEDNSNSPSFVDVLKNDSCHSPPLKRERKYNKEHREK
jgi:hypothetical protein